MLWDSQGWFLFKRGPKCNLPYCNNLSYHCPVGGLPLITRAGVLVVHVPLRVKKQFRFPLYLRCSTSKAPKWKFSPYLLGCWAKKICQEIFDAQLILFCLICDKLSLSLLKIVTVSVSGSLLSFRFIWLFIGLSICCFRTPVENSYGSSVWLSSDFPLWTLFQRIYATLLVLSEG